MSLEKLKRRLNVTDTDRDALLGDLLEDAEAFVLGYTGRKSMLDELKGVVVELAAASYNLLGLEGRRKPCRGRRERDGGPAAQADESAAGYVQDRKGGIACCKEQGCGRYASSSRCRDMAGMPLRRRERRFWPTCNR